MPEIHGNISSIRRSSIERLELIYDIEIERKEFCTVELLEELAHFTEAVGREAMVYIDRSGRIMDVVVGERGRVSLPALSNRRSAQRLNGIR